MNILKGHNETHLKILQESFKKEEMWGGGIRNHNKGVIIEITQSEKQ
jgi:hypothetical protein